MELKLIRETIPAAEKIFDGIQEQGVELDYILPDYYPDIFRLVRCEAVPVVTGYSVIGDKLSYELRCDIRILYCGENGDNVQCIVQQQSFSKTAELGRNVTGNADVRISAKTGHINFRAVNKRRLDIRAAVSVKLTVTGEREQEFISDAEGMNIQLRKIPVRYAAQRLNANKNVQVSEDTEIAASQPDIICIAACRCTVSQCDVKTVSGKLLVKGEVTADILYSCQKDGSSALEPVSFPVSYSQVVDMDGIDDSFEHNVTAEVVSCEVSPIADRSGSNRTIHCDLELHLICNSVRIASATAVSDAYSTVYPCEVTFSEIHAEQLPEVYTENFRRTAVLAQGESVPAAVYSVWCSPKNINARIAEDGRSVMLSGMLTYSMAAKDSSGMIVMPDKNEAFEEKIAVGSDISGKDVSADIRVSGVSYNISSDGVLTAKAELTADITSGGSSSITAVTDIVVDASSKKQRDGDYAVKLYFGIENENVWDIAKRYSTSVDAVMEENELNGEKLENGGMLLIPIKE